MDEQLNDTSDTEVIETQALDRLRLIESLMITVHQLEQDKKKLIQKPLDFGLLGNMICLLIWALISFIVCQIVGDFGNEKLEIFIVFVMFYPIIVLLINQISVFVKKKKNQAKMIMIDIKMKEVSEQIVGLDEIDEALRTIQGVQKLIQYMGDAVNEMTIETACIAVKRIESEKTPLEIEQPTFPWTWNSINQVPRRLRNRLIIIAILELLLITWFVLIPERVNYSDNYYYNSPTLGADFSSMFDVCPVDSLEIKINERTCNLSGNFAFSTKGSIYNPDHLVLLVNITNTQNNLEPVFKLLNSLVERISPIAYKSIISEIFGNGQKSLDNGGITYTDYQDGLKITTFAKRYPDGETFVVAKIERVF